LSGIKIPIEKRLNDKTLRSPGLLKKHYSPLAKLICLQWQNENELKEKLSALGCKPSLTSILCYSNPPSKLGKVTVMPKQAAAYARAIYAELHNCDEIGVKWIIVQTPPDSPEWRAIHDRLHRAAAE